MSTITGSETPPVATQEDVRFPSAFVVYTPSAATMQAVDDHVKGQKIDASKLDWLRGAKARNSPIKTKSWQWRRYRHKLE